MLEGFCLLLRRRKIRRGSSKESARKVRISIVWNDMHAIESVFIGKIGRNNAVYQYKETNWGTGKSYCFMNKSCITYQHYNN